MIDLTKELLGIAPEELRALDVQVVREDIVWACPAAHAVLCPLFERGPVSITPELVRQLMVRDTNIAQWVYYCIDIPKLYVRGLRRRDMVQFLDLQELLLEDQQRRCRWSGVDHQLGPDRLALIIKALFVRTEERGDGSD